MLTGRRSPELHLRKHILHLPVNTICPKALRNVPSNKLLINLAFKGGPVQHTRLPSQEIRVRSNNLTPPRHCRSSQQTESNYYNAMLLINMAD
ncbi:hypothetical protein JTB14_033491 [Gonioctena quinquepunctata]|nr:hypothetical protein JTB14_033491 [Gonioctena quinquepunctata]